MIAGYEIEAGSAPAGRMRNENTFEIGFLVKLKALPVGGLQNFLTLYFQNIKSEGVDPPLR